MGFVVQKNIFLNFKTGQFENALFTSQWLGNRGTKGALCLLLMGNLLLPETVQADPLSADSILITKHANKAADYYEKGDFAMAKDEYRAVIGFEPNAVEPYEGLLSCAEKTDDWGSAAFAAEKISSLSPARKPLYEYDYGNALFHLNRYDEAVPHLKSALATINLPQPVFKPLRSSPQNASGGGGVPATDSLPGAPTLPPLNNSKFQPGASSKIQELERLAEGNLVTSETTVDYSKLENFENAIRSEFICIAEYQGYDKSDDIRFNAPVASHWRIDKILKGPPLNRALPVRYDFHTLSERQPPAGWTFNESRMPVKGSKWILFIEFAYPEGAKKLFTTYDGSYGRQQATEKNLDQLDSLLESHQMKIQGL